MITVIRESFIRFVSGNLLDMRNGKGVCDDVKDNHDALEALRAGEKIRLFGENGVTFMQSIDGTYTEWEPEK